MSDEPAEDIRAVLAKLKCTLRDDIPYRLDLLFPKLSGWGVKGEIKRKCKLIGQLENQLSKMLHPGEEVLYVAQGVQNKFWEQYFLGVWAIMINRTAFVLTNARLLLLHVDSKSRPRHQLWMIYYSQIQEFTSRWTGTVSVKLRDGNKLSLTGFRKQDRQQMPMIFEQALATYRERGFDPEVSQSRENMCQHCLECVPRDEFICAECGAEYWKPRDVALRSLIFPSWGDFLMGHWVLGLVELLGYCIPWVIIVTLFLNDGPDAMELVPALVVSGVLLLMAHVPDSILTYTIAKKGLNLIRGPSKPLVETEDDSPESENAEPT